MQPDLTIPWHIHRGMSIDNSVFVDTLHVFKSLRSSYKTYLMCGSIGAFMYIDFAKSLGATCSELDSIGVSIINIFNTTYINFLKRNGIRVCPYPISVDSINSMAIDEHDVYIISPDDSYNSSDHILLDVALRIKARYIFFIKQGVPKFYVGFDKPTTLNTLSVQDLIYISDSYNETPGRKYMLDRGCLDLINDFGSAFYLINPSDIRSILPIMEGKHVPTSTQVTPG